MEAIQKNQQIMSYYIAHIALNRTFYRGLERFIANSMKVYFEDFQNTMQHQKVSAKTKKERELKKEDGHLLNDEGYKYFGRSEYECAFNYESLTANRNQYKRKDELTYYDVPDSEEFTLLYLKEFMAKSVDAGALLTVIKKSSYFNPEITQLAEDVLEQVRNRTAHAVFKEWTDDRREKALNQLIELAEAIGLDCTDIEDLKTFRDKNVELFFDNFTIKDEMESFCRFLVVMSGDEDITVTSMEEVFPDCKSFIRSLLAKLTSSAQDIGLPNNLVIPLLSILLKNIFLQIVFDFFELRRTKLNCLPLKILGSV
jgi:hypothetical protein